MNGYIRKLFSLVVIREGDKVLLGYKKRGFGAGRWNGFGGKVEAGETPIEGAARELEEESGLKVGHGALERVGELEFTFEGDTTLMHVHVFTTTTYTGIPSESDEMRPAWFTLDKIPYPDMWPDDVLWYPVFLKGGKFRGSFHFKDHDHILSQNLEEVDCLGA